MKLRISKTVKTIVLCALCLLLAFTCLPYLGTSSDSVIADDTPATATKSAVSASIDIGEGNYLDVVKAQENVDAFNNDYATTWSAWYGSTGNVLHGNITLKTDTDKNWYFGIFDANTYFDAPLYVCLNATAGTASFVSKTLSSINGISATLPACNVTKSGDKFNFEIGGLDVLSSADGSKQGVFFYFDLNGERLLEAYYNGSKPSGNMFTIFSISGDITGYVDANFTRDMQASAVCTVSASNYTYGLNSTANGISAQHKVNLDADGFGVLPDLVENLKFANGKAFAGWELVWSSNALYVPGDKVWIGNRSGYSMTAKYIDFVTLDGAQVKANGTPGLRFITKISAADKDFIFSLSLSKWGTMITSPDMEGYLDIPSSVAFEENVEYTSYTATLKDFVSDGVYDYRNIKFKPQGYATIAPHGVEYTIKAVSGDNERSVEMVAYAALQDFVAAADGEYTYENETGKFYKFDKSQYDVLVGYSENYAPVA